VFKLAVSREKMHSVNRFVLLGILVTSAILPFANIPVFPENNIIPQVEVFSQIMEVPVLNNSLPAISEEIQTVQQTKTASINPVLLIYLFVILLLVFRLIVSVVRVLQIIQKAEKQPFQSYILAVVKDFIHPFSFLRNIVISEKDYTENKEMVITHEYAHIKHFHAIDLVICELFTAIHWFNPFMWLLRRDLRLIHEYQADQAVLNKGIDATKYQLLVIEKAVGERRFAMANHFKQKPILKRIKMMKKENKKQWSWVKIILFIPALILLLQAFSRPEISSDKSIVFKLNNTSLEQVKVFPNDTLIKSSPISISIKVGGEIYFEKEKYSIIDLEKRLKEIRLSWFNENSKLEEDYLLIANLNVGYGVEIEDLLKVHEALRKAKILNINHVYELQVNSEAALKNSYFTLDNETYQLESSILGNESYENIGKFELDLFPYQYDKKIALYFLSIKSNSIDSPDIASYKYDANNSTLTHL
jgi:beta-lactamase regulating signal transducer with metallopeptidase domain